MKKLTRIFLIVLTVLLLLPPTAGAQEGEPELSLKLRRLLGYGGLSGDIQGTFSMRVTGPDDLIEVRFYVDGELIGTDTESGFSLQFNTANFDPGIHTLFAVGLRADGSELRSNELPREFLSGEQAFSSTINLILPILGVLLALTLLGSVLPALTGRGGKTRPIGQYGMTGGAVCGRCNLPYSRPFLGLNLVVGKLSRCPHCGKWAVARRANAAEVAAAEDRLRADRSEGQVEVRVDEEESLRRALEDSRFDD